MADNKYGLDDFISGQQASIDDFISQTNEEAQKADASQMYATNRNNAAYGGLLNAPSDPNQMLQTYSAIKNEYDTIGESPTYRQVLGARRNQAMGDYTTGLVDFLASPSYDDTAKYTAMQNVRDTSNPLYSPQTMLASQSAAEYEIGNNQQVDNFRFAAAQSDADLQRYREAKQNAINAIIVHNSNLSGTQQAIGTGASIAESFFPGGSNAQIASQLGEIKDHHMGVYESLRNFFAPGQGKREALDNFNSLPVSERSAAIKDVAAALNNAGTSITMTDKSVSNLEFLNQMIRNEDYTFTEQSLDNAGLIIDVLGGAIGKGFGKLSDLITGAKKVNNPAAEEAARMAREFAYDDATDVARDAARSSITETAAPIAPAEVLKNTNPEKARRLASSAEKDPSGELVGALHGTDEIGSTINLHAASPAKVNGAIPNKLPNPGKYSDVGPVPNEDIIAIYNGGAGDALPSAERINIHKNVLQNMYGPGQLFSAKLKPVPNISSVDEAASGNMKISVAYMVGEAGTTFRQAMEQAREVGARYGVDQNDISILRKSPELDEWQPIRVADLEQTFAQASEEIGGEFAVQVSRELPYSPSMLNKSDFSTIEFGVTNTLNRLAPTGAASKVASFVSENLLDPASLQDPKIMRGATLATLKNAKLGSSMEKHIKEFSDGAAGLGKDKFNALIDEIKAANVYEGGRAIDRGKLVMEKGFSPEDLKSVDQWERIQDTNWMLTNMDMVKTYSNKGFGALVDDAGTFMVAKPVSAGRIPKNARVYNPSTGEVLSKEEVQTFIKERAPTEEVIQILESLGQKYINARGAAQLRHPMEVNTPNGKQWADYIITEGQGMRMRALREDDNVLQYRKGYYAVRYTDPHFIVRAAKGEDGRFLLDENGEKQYVAVATASTQKQAATHIERLKGSHPDDEFIVRSNLKDDALDSAFEDVYQNGRMSSQKLRGKRVSSAEGDNMDLSAAHIEGPMESLINSVRAIASRVSFRDWVEASKQRFLAQYSDVLPLQYGVPKYPSSIEEIGKKGQKAGKMQGDARAMWTYIKAMEDGYRSTLDDGVRAGFQILSSASAKVGFEAGEKVANKASNIRITSEGKMAVFHLAISSTPFRQWLVQGAQGFVTLSRYPAYSTRIVQDQIAMLSTKLGKELSPDAYKAIGLDKAQFETMLKHMDDSGIAADFTNHELANALLDNMADTAWSTRRAVYSAQAKSKGGVGRAFYLTRAYAGAVFAAGKKVGFDAGEHFVQSSAYFAAYRDALAKNAGKELSREQLRDVAQAARNITGNFDKAGAIRYNSGILALPLQFAQVTHKMLMLLTTNRQIPTKSKMQMGVLGALTFGIPTETLEGAVESRLPEGTPTFVRDAVKGGVISAAYNAIVSEVWGEGARSDFSGTLNAYDTASIHEMLTNLMTLNIPDLFKDSPAGQLIFGNNPRISNLVGTLTDYMYDPDLKEAPVKWSNIVKDVAALTSGTSNLYKSYYLYRYHKAINASGQTLVEGVETPAAIAQIFGLPPEAVTQSYAAQKKMKDEIAQHRADVKEVFTAFNRRMVGQEFTPDSTEYWGKALRVAMNNFNVEDRLYFMELAKQKAQDGDDSMYKLFSKYAGITSPEEARKVLNSQTAMPDENRRDIERMLDTQEYVKMWTETQKAEEKAK